jgi:trans-2,3-dihydro-3-hydroxyanthranilate isomerase
VVDVFTDTPLEGNPLAVFPDAAGLDGDDAACARRTSETTHHAGHTGGLCGESADFHAVGEMVFAGHPTVGTSYVLLDEGAIRAGLPASSSKN